MEYKFENDIFFNSKMEIVGYENYLIYSDGKVYNQKYKRYLKQDVNWSGYSRVNLCKDGTVKKYSVHRLIALHYIKNDENKPYVDHINRDRSDNRVENLRWVTPTENNENVGENKRNTSGHKNIDYHKKNRTWRFNKQYRKKIYLKHFISKKEALCFKFVFLLKIKCNII